MFVFSGFSSSGSAFCTAFLIALEDSVALETLSTVPTSALVLPINLERIPLTAFCQNVALVPGSVPLSSTLTIFPVSASYVTLTFASYPKVSTFAEPSATIPSGFGAFPAVILNVRFFKYPLAATSISYVFPFSKIAFSPSFASVLTIPVFGSMICTEPRPLDAYFFPFTVTDVIEAK